MSPTPQTAAAENPAELLIGKSTDWQGMPLKYANRHGLIAGATGTGKTVTLQTLAEQFCRAGVPVFLADIKGDLAGISQPGSASPRIDERIQALGLPSVAFRGCPSVFWDVFGEQGHPMRTTVSEMGPFLLSRLLELSEAQEGALSIVFRVADEEGLLLIDCKDLRALLNHIAEHTEEVSQSHGLVTKQTIAAIQRKLMMLEEQGGTQFFGEPAFAVNDFFRPAPGGEGFVHVLAANKLMLSPRIYATFLLWLLSELFEQLPEVGDVEKPRLVFFFDEAHLLFEDAPKILLEKIEQVVRLIRSKGVGVYFITQNPQDIPEDVLGQLGNRIQHALRAFTPKDQKAIRAAAETFRANPAFKVEEAITELAVGEALVSTLQEKGIPGMVERTLIMPPSSRIGTISDAERQQIIKTSPFAANYGQAFDRESAYELLAKRTQQKTAAPAPSGLPSSRRADPWGEAPQKPAPAPREAKPRTSNRQSTGEALVKSVVRSVGSQVGREVGRALLRGILGSLK